MKQLKLLKPENKAFGGSLYKKRKGRTPRPLATRETMHLVLKSSKARAEKSFWKPKNAAAIKQIVH